MVDGSAGGGVVKATVTGKQELVVASRSIRRAVDPADVEMLQDLVVAAVNDALGASRELGRAEDGRASPAASAAARDARPTRVATPVIEPVARLIESFARLPGIGPKTAQRLTYHLLRAPGRRGADARRRAGRRPRPGRLLRPLLQHQRRSRSARSAATRAATRRRLCVVEEPLDVLALERTGEFKGLYHVLHGAISPIDGIGPDRLRIRELLARADDGEARRRRRSSRSSSPRTRPSRARRPRCTSPSGSRTSVGVVSRIARGLPVGGDLEYADEVTLIRALQGRRAV